MKRFFFKGTKVAKYGKLKNSPLLLDSLDVDSLIPLDLELQRFVAIIKNDVILMRLPCKKYSSF